MGQKVFISYSHQQKTWVKQLVAQLTNANIDIWWDENITHTTADWREDIDKAIDNSSLFLLVMTPKANESPYVTFEWSYAMGKGKVIIIVLLEPVDQIHPRLKTNLHIDFTDYSHDYDKLISVIKGHNENNRNSSSKSYHENLIQLLVEFRSQEYLTRPDLHKFLNLGIITEDDIDIIENSISND